MSKYQMQDGTVINTEKAIQSWDEDVTWNGSNYISKATDSQTEHEILYKSRKGRYYKECWSNWQGSISRVEWLSEHAACRWMLVNNCDLPEDLQAIVEEVEE